MNKVGMQNNRTALPVLLLFLVLIASGCGSTLAIIDDPPYTPYSGVKLSWGCTQAPYWSEVTFGYLDLPLSVVVDSALLPISGLIWWMQPSVEDSQEYSVPVEAIERNP